LISLADPLKSDSEEPLGIYGISDVLPELDAVGG
jgi:hypothetical protein